MHLELSQPVLAVSPTQAEQAVVPASGIVQDHVGVHEGRIDGAELGDAVRAEAGAAAVPFRALLLILLEAAREVGWREQRHDDLRAPGREFGAGGPLEAVRVADAAGDVDGVALEGGV